MRQFHNFFYVFLFLQNWRKYNPTSPQYSYVVARVLPPHLHVVPKPAQFSGCTWSSLGCYYINWSPVKVTYELNIRTANQYPVTTVFKTDRFLGGVDLPLWGRRQQARSSLRLSRQIISPCSMCYSRSFFPIISRQPWGDNREKTRRSINKNNFCLWKWKGYVSVNPGCMWT